MTRLDAIQDGFIPVISTVAQGVDGETAYNINADTAAAKLAVALKAEKLVFLTDVDGIRMQADDPASLISAVSVSEVGRLIADGVITGGMIPTFLVVKNLGLIDTVWSLVLPGLVSPWNMFIMKNYFQTSIPTELYEAASIDGADNFHLLRSVVLPLSAPIVAVMVLYYGVAHWNSYFNALLYLRDRTRYPLQLVLRSFFSANDYSEQGGAGGDSGMTALLVSETMKYALIVIASGPILCLYPLLQRFFVKGVMLGAIKG